MAECDIISYIWEDDPCILFSGGRCNDYYAEHDRQLKFDSRGMEAMGTFQLVEHFPCIILVAEDGVSLSEDELRKWGSARLRLSYLIGWHDVFNPSFQELFHHPAYLWTLRRPHRV